MGNQQSTAPQQQNQTAKEQQQQEKPKLKPCCVCLDTKKIRDEW